MKWESIPVEFECGGAYERHHWYSLAPTFNPGRTSILPTSKRKYESAPKRDTATPTLLTVTKNINKTINSLQVPLLKNANPSGTLQGFQSCPLQLSKFTSNRHFTPIAGRDVTHTLNVHPFTLTKSSSPTKWSSLPYYVRSTSLPSLSAHHQPLVVLHFHQRSSTTPRNCVTISPQRINRLTAQQATHILSIQRHPTLPINTFGKAHVAININTPLYSSTITTFTPTLYAIHNVEATNAENKQNQQNY